MSNNKQGHAFFYVICAMYFIFLLLCITNIYNNIKQFNTDYFFHTEVAQKILEGNFFNLRAVHIVFHVTAALVAKAFGFGMDYSSIITATTFKFTTFIFLIYFVSKENPDIDINKSILIALIISLVSSVYIPYFNKNFYLGTWSQNPWHSPTYLAMQALSIPLYFHAKKILVKNQSANYFSLFILIVLSSFSKPSFVIILTCTTLFYLTLFLIYSINTENKITEKLKRLIFLFVICVFVIIFQYFFAFGENKDRVMIGLFIVSKLYSVNILLSILQLSFFPILLISTNYKSLFSVDVRFSIILYLSGLFCFSFFYEFINTGAANFAWGYMIGAFFLFYEATIYMFKNFKNIYFPKLNLAIFSCHLISGIMYLQKMSTTGRFF